MSHKACYAKREGLLIEIEQLRAKLAQADSLAAEAVAKEAAMWRRMLENLLKRARESHN